MRHGTYANSPARVLIALFAAMLIPSTGADNAAASAGTVVIPYWHHGVALAGDGLVVAQEHRLRPVRITRRDPGGTTTLLARVKPPTPPGSDFYSVEELGASATTWVAVLSAWTDARFPDEEDGQPAEQLSEMMVSGPVAGGPVTTLSACTGTSFVSFGVAVAGDDVAWANASCPGGDGVHLAEAGKPARQVAAYGTDVGLAGSHLAYFSGLATITEVDRSTGAERKLDAFGVEAFNLGAHGVDAVVAPDDPGCTGERCRLSVLRVGADGKFERPALAHVPPDTRGLVFGGGRVLMDRPGGNGVESIDLGTGAVTYAGALGLGFGDTPPIDVDARRALYTAADCEDDLEYYIESTKPGLPARLDNVPCPMHVLRRSATLPKGRLRTTIPVRCPRGCGSDEWEIVHAGQFLGLFSPDVPPGATVQAPLVLEQRGRWHRAHVVTITLRPVTERVYMGHPKARQPDPVRIRLRLSSRPG